MAENEGEKEIQLRWKERDGEKSWKFRNLHNLLFIPFQQQQIFEQFNPCFRLLSDIVKDLVRERERDCSKRDFTWQRNILTLEGLTLLSRLLLFEVFLAKKIHFQTTFYDDFLVSGSPILAFTQVYKCITQSLKHRQSKFCYSLVLSFIRHPFLYPSLFSISV